MDDDHQADEWLMRDVAAGRREPLAVLVRRYASRLLTFIQRMIGDRHRSEELFQDVFLAVWTGRYKYQYPRPFRSWLFGIAVKKCHAAFRRPGMATIEEDEATVPVAAGPSPVESAIATETAAMVAAAVARLPVGQRTVLVLRIWNGLSYEEIAQIVGRTEATVRSHMFYGLAGVRKHLEPRMRSL